MGTTTSLAQVSSVLRVSTRVTGSPAGTITLPGSKPLRVTSIDRARRQRRGGRVLLAGGRPRPRPVARTREIRGWFLGLLRSVVVFGNVVALGGRRALGVSGARSASSGARWARLAAHRRPGRPPAPPPQPRPFQIANTAGYTVSSSRNDVARPPTIGARDPLHHVGAGAGAPQDRHQADHHRQHGHQLGPDAAGRAVDDRLAQVAEACASARRPPRAGATGSGRAASPPRSRRRARPGRSARPRPRR